MSGTSAVRPALRVSRLLLGALTAVLGHAVTFGAGFVAGRTVSPSSGGGFEDIAAVALVFLGGQAILGLGCIIASVSCW